MEQRISLVTLGVLDVERARTFYEQLGWRGQTIDGTVFFQVGGLGLVLWGHDALAADAGLDPAGPSGFRGVALAQNVRSRAEVDAVMASAGQAGATVTRPAVDTFYGGYAGYFTDPDGHTWEVAYNPAFRSPRTARSRSRTSARREGRTSRPRCGERNGRCSVRAPPDKEVQR